MKIRGKEVSINLHIILFSALIVIISAIIIIYSGAGKKQKSYESTEEAVGTYVQQTVYGDNSQKAANLAVKRIQELESLILDESSSDIYKINKEAGKTWVDINEKTMEILSMSLDVAERSSGAYDPTSKNIIDLWGFKGAKQRIPSQSEISKYLPYVNYSNLKVNTDVQRAKLFEPLSSIDLYGVIQGVACDEAIGAYKKSRADSGIISVGNSVGVYGSKKDHTPWRIAIKDPFNNDDDIKSVAILKVENGCVSTSGAYENKFKKDGKVYHHIINPKTGYPADNNLASVTVSHKNGFLTSALSLACNVLGVNESKYLLEYYGADAVFIDNNKNIYTTSSIKDKLMVTDEDYKLVELD